MGPIDYTIDVQSPFQAVAQGYQLGAGIRNDFQNQAALRQQAEAERAAQIAQQAERQRQSDVLNALISNKGAGAQDYAAASLLVPGMKDQLKQAWDMKSTDQQANALRDMGQAWNAIAVGKPEIAVQQLRSRAQAMEASGANPQEIRAVKTQADLIEAHPQFARAQIGMSLASLPGGDKVLSAAATAGQEGRAQAEAPADLAKKNAEAGIKTVEASYAPQVAAVELENKVEDAETKRFNRKIATLDTQIKQANSETQRGELTLKREEAIAKRDEATKKAGDAAQSKLDKLDQSLGTVNAIFAHPGVKSALGFGGVGSATGKLSGYIPGSDRKDLQGLVDTLQAQQFLTGVQNLVGMGALSDAEGKKIGSAVASLDLDQSTGQFKTALNVIKTELEKAQRTAIAGNAPMKGGAFVIKSPKFGNVTEGDVNRMLQANPGSTREQVMQYLRQGSKPAGTGGASGGY